MTNEKANLYRYLVSLPNVQEATDYWVATRCVLCGDSKKNPNKKRLYIHCDPTTPSEGVGYICFNCNATGILTRDMLNEISDSEDMGDTLRRVNKNAEIHGGGSVKVNKFGKPLKTQKVIFPKLRAIPHQLKKYEYVKQRIGVSIPPEDFENLKIVWSLKDFLAENGLGFNDRDKMPPSILEEKFVGFSSVRNEYILFRSIDESVNKKYRWHKYNIFGLSGDLSSQYTIRNQIDPVSPDTIRIIAAEGVFDVLSIYYNLFNGTAGNNIFTATANGSFENAIKKYLVSGIVGGNVKVDCYIDNDSIYDYAKLWMHISPYLIAKQRNFHVYHNVIRKDFGVPLSEIQVEELSI